MAGKKWWKRKARKVSEKGRREKVSMKGIKGRRERGGGKREERKERQKKGGGEKGRRDRGGKEPQVGNCTGNGKSFRVIHRRENLT